MPFCKVVKTKSYFMRYQTAFRRRREGKTDYNARRALIHQDKRKYNTPKYRLVVRFTNTDVIAQIVYARIEGDYVLCAAYAHELPRYGVPVGLKNYAATYCTGLLLARRVLAKLNLADKYAGVAEPTGEKTTIEPIEDGPKPFKCVLDSGLARTTTGARVFAALKGAVDGGLLIPHNEKRFVGFQRKEKKFDAAILREHIFGQHVAKWMKILEEEDKEKFDAHFAQFIKHKITAAGLEKMYKSAHQKIRADPSFKATEKKKPEHAGPIPLKYRRLKMSLAQRKARFAQKLEQIRKRMGPIAPIEFGKTSDVQGAEEEPEPEKPVKTQKGDEKEEGKKGKEADE